MASERLLIADSQSVRLRLTQTFLSNEGYKVSAAADASEALSQLTANPFDLLFANFESGAESGLEFIRSLKRRPDYRPLVTIAGVAPGEEGKAIEAGCDATLARPIATASLAALIRQLFQQPAASAAVVNPRTSAVAELDGLRARFLAEGAEKAHALLEQTSHSKFEVKPAAKAVHQWAGTGGLLGFNAISRLAGKAEGILAEHPLDIAELRDTLEALVEAFAAADVGPQPLPETIVTALSGKHIAAVEFTPYQQERLSAALDTVRARAVFLTTEDSPACEAAASADILIIDVTPETVGSSWLDPAGPLSGAAPVVLAGTRDALAALTPGVQALARGFLMDSWAPDEALVRLSLAAAQPTGGKRQRAVDLRPQTRVVIADDDPAVLAIVRTTLENFGMDCHTAENGAGAIAAIRKLRPDAAVLDVNMPDMDGYEVLSSVRRQELAVRVLLLTARQQERDVLRGFTLGADDYVVKPFSPMELVARLKRLVAK